MFGVFEQILAFEQGELSLSEAVAMFDKLISSGEIWRLPTIYMEKAAIVIASREHTIPQGAN